MDQNSRAQFELFHNVEDENQTNTNQTGMMDLDGEQTTGCSFIYIKTKLGYPLNHLKLAQESSLESDNSDTTNTMKLMIQTPTHNNDDSAVTQPDHDNSNQIGGGSGSISILKQQVYNKHVMNNMGGTGNPATRSDFYKNQLAADQNQDFEEDLNAYRINYITEPFATKYHFGKAKN